MKGREFYIPQEYLVFVIQFLNEFKNVSLKLNTYNSMLSALEEKLSLDECEKKKVREWNFAFEFTPLITTAYLGVYFEREEQGKRMEEYGVLEIRLESSDKNKVCDYHKIFFSEFLRKKGLLIEKLPRIEEENDVGIIVYNGIVLEERIKNVIGGSYEQILRE